MRQSEFAAPLRNEADREALNSLAGASPHIEHDAPRNCEIAVCASDFGTNLGGRSFVCERMRPAPLRPIRSSKRSAGRKVGVSICGGMPSFPASCIDSADKGGVYFFGDQITDDCVHRPIE